MVVVEAAELVAAAEEWLQVAALAVQAAQWAGKVIGLEAQRQVAAVVWATEVVEDMALDG